MGRNLWSTALVWRRMTATATPSQSVEVDAAIIDGGIAGLWLLNLLNARGYRALLLEAQTLGGGQTLASQGMIHGGLKYALSGRLSGASEAIAAMPARWRDCLDGRGPVDLRGLPLLSREYYMFSRATTLGKLAGFFASKTLRGRIEKIGRADYPEGLRPFDGVVYRLNDFVMDTATLLNALLAPVAHLAYQQTVRPGQLERTSTGWRVSTPGLRSPTSSKGMIHARTLIFSAGIGNASLLEALPGDRPEMQSRPLHQVIVRHPQLGQLYAHCLTGITRPEPRLTITAHPDPASSGWLWYLGGQIATDGVAMGQAALVEHARAELTACVPWIDWRKASFDTLRVDRAEPAQARGGRPDEAFAQRIDDCVLCWPTKLSLAPDLGDRVLDLLPAPRSAAASTLPLLTLPIAGVGHPPWVPAG